jgi:hypothetical protein
MAMENCLCEFSKYFRIRGGGNKARVGFPGATGPVDGSGYLSTSAALTEAGPGGSGGGGGGGGW